MRLILALLYIVRTKLAGNLDAILTGSGTKLEPAWDSDLGSHEIIVLDELHRDAAA